MWTETEEQQIKFFSGFYSIDTHTHTYITHIHMQAYTHTTHTHTHHEMKGKSPQNAKNGCV